MNADISGILFNGETLAARPVRLGITSGRMHSLDEPGLVDVPLADIRVSERLGDIPRFLYLSGNRTVTTPDNQTVDSWLFHQSRGRLVALIHALEIHHRIAAFATILLVASVAGIVWWGLPVLAREIAMSVPESIEESIGRASLVSFRRVLAASELDRTDRDWVQAQADHLVEVAGITGHPQLMFFSMGGRSPNAFALPGGGIIVSDELVRLAANDGELSAVLAHEIGHWQYRHGIQSILRNSTALLVVATVTGDLSSLTTFAGTIPFMLLQRGYSREFETEADAYALNLLLRAGIDPRHFRSILRKLEASRPQHGTDHSYLGTHPGTEERIQALGHLPPEDPPPGTVSLRKPSLWPSVVKFSDLTFTAPAEAKERDAVEKAPVPRIRAAPYYPSDLREAGVKGSVTVDFIVDENGDVRDVEVVRSSHQGFEAPAIKAVRQWKFVPGRRSGRNIAFRASQLLEFDPNQ